MLAAHGNLAVSLPQHRMEGESPLCMELPRCSQPYLDIFRGLRTLLVAQCSAIGVSVAATPPCRAIRFCKANFSCDTVTEGWQDRCDRVFLGGGGMGDVARHTRDISKTQEFAATLCARHCVARQGSQQWCVTKRTLRVHFVRRALDTFKMFETRYESNVVCPTKMLS